VLPPIASPEIHRIRPMPPSLSANIMRRLVEIGAIAAFVCLLVLFFREPPFWAFQPLPIGWNGDFLTFLGGVLTLALLVGLATVLAGLLGAVLIRWTRVRSQR
jgi:hypothetical protein